jgi:hypothetical protein
VPIEVRQGHFLEVKTSPLIFDLDNQLIFVHFKADADHGLGVRILGVPYSVGASFTHDQFEVIHEVFLQVRFWQSCANESRDRRCQVQIIQTPPKVHGNLNDGHIHVELFLAALW